MSFLETTIVIFTIISVIPTIASLTKFDSWWIRGFDFPRIQISALILIVIIASALSYSFTEIWHYIASGVLILSLIYQLVKIYPYTWIAKKQVLKFRGNGNEGHISILVSNVLSPNNNYQKLIQLVKERQPDILLTLESNKTWEKELEPLEKEYNHTVKVPQENQYGMHLYSKLELIKSKVEFLVQEDIPSIHGSVRLRNGKEVNIYCVHPKPPSPTEDDTSTNRDAELLMIGRYIQAGDNRVVVFGDLNDVAWSRTTRLFQKMSGLLDPRRGRGFFNTYHADHLFLRWPLDHVFHSNDFTLIEISRERKIGSDHFPMYIKLNLEPWAKNLQEEPEADAEDKAWAKEKIEDANPIKKTLNTH